MKNFLVLLITFYQNFLSNIIKIIIGESKFCRFNPSCSEYARQVIIKDGIIKGSYKSILRILKCQPYFRN